jgi:hypothetical protein
VSPVSHGAHQDQTRHCGSVGIVSVENGSEILPGSDAAALRFATCRGSRLPIISRKRNHWHDQLRFPALQWPSVAIAEPQIDDKFPLLATTQAANQT